MSAFHETIKLIISDVDKFLNSTLKDEKLSNAGQKEKNKLLKSLRKLYEEYEVLNPNLEEGSSSSSKGLTDESKFTTGSTHSQGSEEDGSTDNVPYASVKLLNSDAFKMGFLLKKPSDLLEKLTKQKKYCVVHKNVMYWFKKHSDKKHQGAVYLAGYEFKDLSVGDKDFTFELTSSKKKPYQFQADSKKEMEEWKKAIEDGIKFMEQITVKEDVFEEGSGDEYEPIDEVVKAVRSRASFSSPTIITASSPSPVISSSSLLQDIYDDGFSMAVKKEEPVAVTPQQEIEDEDNLIYECVEPPSLQTPTEEELRSSIPFSPPPLPPVSPAKEAEKPPPLPIRGPNIPAPNSAASTKKITPELDKVSLLEDYENLFYSLWSCVSGSDNELSFNQGAIIHVLNRDLDGEHWWVGENDGNVGLVPKSFLMPAYEIVA